MEHNTSQVELKLANESDVEEIKNFMLGIVKEDFGYDFNPEWHKDISELQKVYMNAPRACLFVALENGKVIGTLAARPYDRLYPQFKNRYNEHSTLGIWRHYVKKTMRGKGIGKQLYALLESFAKDRHYATLYLHTQKTIPGSLEYWLARGFSVTQKSNDELQTIHMEKVLSNTYA